MKIAYLHQYFRTPHMAGGTRSYEFARRLVRDGHDVHVITTRTDAPHATDWSTEIIDGVHVHWLGNPYDNRMSFARRVRSFLRFSVLATLRMARLRADVNIATSTPLTVAVPALVNKLFRRTPYMFEVRDLWPEMPIAVGAIKSRSAIALLRLLERLAYRGASQIVALSPGMAQGVVRVDGRPQVVSVVPNSCDASMGEASPQDIAQVRAARSWLGDRPLVIYAGTLGRLNGVGYLVDLAHETAKVAPDMRFLIVGDGAERERIAHRAGELGVLGTSLFIEDAIPKSEMPAMLGAADMACSLFAPIPEMEINSANKFFDGLASGTPVMINYGGWHRDLIVSNAAGLALGPHVTQEAATRLVDFLNCELKSREAAKRAGMLARHEFEREALYGAFRSAVMSAASRGDSG